MSATIMFTGTNCSGKTSLMKFFLSIFKNIQVGETLTFAEYGKNKIAIVGRYNNKSSCNNGYDSFSKGPLKSRLYTEIAARDMDYLFVEGSILNSFGADVLKLLFSKKVDKYYVFNLYANNRILAKRLKTRSRKNVCYNRIFTKKKSCWSALKKLHSIGVNIMAIDTGKFTTEVIAERIKKIIGLKEE